MLRANHPREQGLKPCVPGCIHPSGILRANHPREQGLKHRAQKGDQDLHACFERIIQENKD